MTGVQTCALPISDFSFLLLDQLGTIKGWHEPSSSGIYANEVRDTRKDLLTVKAFKGGVLAEGLYKAIKDRVHTVGGQFVANCYIAFKDGGGLTIGAIGFKGAALRTWMEFTKVHRTDLYSTAIVIRGFTEGKKGRITYRMPQLDVKDISEPSNIAAMKLDERLQEYLTGYFARTQRDQVEDSQEAHEQEEPANLPPPDDEYVHAPDDDIPF